MPANGMPSLGSARARGRTDDLEPHAPYEPQGKSIVDSIISLPTWSEMRAAKGAAERRNFVQSELCPPSPSAPRPLHILDQRTQQPSVPATPSNLSYTPSAPTRVGQGGKGIAAQLQSRHEASYNDLFSGPAPMPTRAGGQWNREAVGAGAKAARLAPSGPGMVVRDRVLESKRNDVAERRALVRLANDTLGFGGDGDNDDGDCGFQDDIDAGGGASGGYYASGSRSARTSSVVGEGSTRIVDARYDQGSARNPSGGRWRGSRFLGDDARDEGDDCGVHRGTGHGNNTGEHAWGAGSGHEQHPGGYASGHGSPGPVTSPGQWGRRTVEQPVGLHITPRLPLRIARRPEPRSFLRESGHWSEADTPVLPRQSDSPRDATAGQLQTGHRQWEEDQSRQPVKYLYKTVPRLGTDTARVAVVGMLNENFPRDMAHSGMDTDSTHVTACLTWRDEAEFASGAQDSAYAGERDPVKYMYKVVPRLGADEKREARVGMLNENFPREMAFSGKDTESPFVTPCLNWRGDNEPLVRTDVTGERPLPQRRQPFDRGMRGAGPNGTAGFFTHDDDSSRRDAERHGALQATTTAELAAGHGYERAPQAASEFHRYGSQATSEMRGSQHVSRTQKLYHLQGPGDVFLQSQQQHASGVASRAGGEDFVVVSPYGVSDGMSSDDVDAIGQQRRGQDFRRRVTDVAPNEQLHHLPSPPAVARHHRVDIVRSGELCRRAPARSAVTSVEPEDSPERDQIWRRQQREQSIFGVQHGLLPHSERDAARRNHETAVHISGAARADLNSPDWMLSQHSPMRDLRRQVEQGSTPRRGGVHTQAIGGGIRVRFDG